MSKHLLLPVVLALSVALGHGSRLMAQSDEATADENPVAAEAPADESDGPAVPVLPPEAELPGWPAVPPVDKPFDSETTLPTTDEPASNALPDDPILGWAPGSPNLEQDEASLTEPSAPSEMSEPLVVLPAEDPVAEPSSEADADDEDPFGAAAPESDAADDDPFGAPPADKDMTADDDPFGAAAQRSDADDDNPFGEEAPEADDDLFGAPLAEKDQPADDDPFGAPASDSDAAADDPFGAAAPKTPTTDDPFGAPSTQTDKPAVDDPFAAPASESDAATADPFGGSPAADPFGGGARGHETVADPFSSPAADATAERESADQPTAEPEAAADRPAVAAGEEAIEAALAKPTAMEFIETPLSDVADFLQDLHRINIVIDRRALEDLGLEVDCPFTINVKGISLESALDLVLRQRNLTWTVANEALVITSPEEAENDRITRVYDVADLVVCRDADDELWEDYDLLMEVLRSTVEPTSWDEVGGPGSIEGGTFGAGKVLVVAQTFRVHRKIVKLLADLRAVAANTPAATQAPRRDRPTLGNIPPVFSAPMGVGGLGMPAGGGFMPAKEEDAIDDPFGEKSMGGGGGTGGTGGGGGFF